jgi:1-aminocyclopropane-1-carboxylate deaminase
LSVNTTYQPIDISKASVQSLQDDALQAKNMAAAILRLDLIHPVISGNKWFKLKYYLQQAVQEQKKGLLTFGGAWSNHLVAAAYACMQTGIDCVGVVRGKPDSLYPSLRDAMDYHMQLVTVERAAYANEQQLAQDMLHQYPDYLIVPQGGQGAPGVAGAAEITMLLPFHQYTHILCAVGTGTMLAGLVKSSLPHQQVIGISSLKVDAHHNTMAAFVQQQTGRTNFSIVTDYHFGGYARCNDVLVTFMNDFYDRHQVPTDFVYTGKLLYGVWDMIGKDYFLPGSRLLIVHSGGLQGNRSLAGRLKYDARK